MAEKSYNISNKKAKVPHEIYHKHKDHFDKIEEIIDHLKKAEQITEQEILSILRDKDSLKAVPLSIFSGWLGPLEALVKYMKDHMHLTLSQIAKLLERDPRTIWLTYRNAKKKNLDVPISHDHFVPLEIFSNRKFSILENLSTHLHEIQGLAFKEIADILKKDNRTIWTVYSRVRKKRLKK